LAASLFSIYGRPPALRNALVVGISQSGQSPDIASVVAEGSHQGAPTLAITNDPGSPLEQTAEFVIDTSAGPEEAVAATKTHTAQLLATAMLAVALGGKSDRLAAL
jgi:glucosamine--fructose-6-phosphate aminotransferase (isomerizing)